MNNKSLRIGDTPLACRDIIILSALLFVCCFLSSCATNPTIAFDPEIDQDPTKITTLILTAGQSNAVGSFSANQYNGDLPNGKTQDDPDKRVWVWARVSDPDDPDFADKPYETGSHQWVKAELIKNGAEHFWIKPGTFGRPGTSTTVETVNAMGKQSHAGFQIARHIVENSRNIVGIIPTGRSGMPIDSWWWNDSENDALTDMIKNASDAVAALEAIGNNAKVGLVWWMQGETDAILADTTIPTPALPDPEYAPSDFADEYIGKLNAILNRLKGETWFFPTNGLYKMFVANKIYETNDSDYSSGDSAFLRFNNNTDRPRIQANQRALNKALDDSFDRKLEEIQELINGNPERRFLVRCTNLSDSVEVNKDRIHFDALTLKSIGKSVSNLYLAPLERNQQGIGRCLTVRVES